MQKIGSRTYNSAHAKLAMLRQHHMSMVKVLWYLNMRNYLFMALIWGQFSFYIYSHSIDLFSFHILCSTSGCRKSVATFPGWPASWWFTVYMKINETCQVQPKMINLAGNQTHIIWLHNGNFLRVDHCTILAYTFTAWCELIIYNFSPKIYKKIYHTFLLRESHRGELCELLCFG